MAIYLFIIGISFGSFALVLADRMHAGKDWVKGRSHCDKCKKTLGIKDLVPILSWLSSGGKCRHCGVTLSKAYPLAELGLGLAFALSFVSWPYELSGTRLIALFVLWLLALVLMSALFIFDVRWFLLPNKLVYPLIIVGFAWAVLQISIQGFTSEVLVGYLISVAIGGGIFLLLFLVSSGKWIGDGDIRLGVAIGLFTGNWVHSWLTIFIASVIGVIISLPTLIKTKNKKKVMKLKMPFGPMLILALLIVVLFGTRIIDWYSSSLLLS